MPTSSPEGKLETVQWVAEIRTPMPRVLDLGTGKGIYCGLFRSIPTSPLARSRWTGVEAWAPYIETFGLRRLYDEIINEDIRKVDYEAIGPFDIAFAGDVLEHLTKEEAVDVVSRVLACCPRLVISIPIVHYPQGPVDGNPFEAHVKDDWSHAEMLETFPQISKIWVGRELGCYLLLRP